MTRAAFDNTCDVFYGLRSVVGPPGTQYASGIPCRLVPQTEINQLQFPFTLTGSWLTIDALTPNGPFVSSPFDGATFTDYKAGDIVVIPSFGVDIYTVCRSEYVQPFGRPGYFRYLLIPSASLVSPPWYPPVSPPPSPTPVPAIVPAFSCAGAPEVGAWGPIVSLDLSGSDTWFRVMYPPTTTCHLYVTGGQPDMIVTAYQFGCGSLSPIAGMTGPGTLGLGAILDPGAFIKVEFPTSPGQYGALSGP